jgi:hypothetical protein
VTFAFEHWRSWLAGKAELLKARGMKVRVGGHDFPAKPKTMISIAGKNAIADFENWKSGETDYTVFRLRRPWLTPWRKVPEQFATRWGVVADDASFEGLYEEFVARFLEAEAQ